MAISSNQQDQDDVGLDILEKVELKSFTATPTAIGPFGASILSWEVTGPPGFRVELNQREVAKSGEQVVQPNVTTTYRLAARVTQLRKPLGSVRVEVDSSACQINPIVNAHSTIRAPVAAFIRNSKELYLLPGLPPEVTFSPGRIRLRLVIKARLDFFPDPTVRIDSSFGLAVRDGALEATGEQISVDISVPFWAWAIPGAIPGLAVAIDGAEEGAKTDMHNAILGLVALLNFNLTPPEGFRMQSVRVDDGNNGAGIIEITQCPYSLLTRLAGISQVSALE